MLAFTRGCVHSLSAVHRAARASSNLLWHAAEDKLQWPNAWTGCLMSCIIISDETNLQPGKSACEVCAEVAVLLQPDHSMAQQQQPHKCCICCAQCLQLCGVC